MSGSNLLAHGYFFAFVTMQFKSATTLNITLPKVETAGKNTMKGNVTISIDKDESVLFNNQKVTDDELVTMLQQQHDLNPDTPVLLKADETTQLKKLAFVWDACRRTGLSNVNIQSR